MTVLWTALAAVLSYATVVAHEAAHAVAMRRLGVRVAEVAFGLPLWPQWKLAPTTRRPFTLSLSPWPLSAHVRAHKDDVDRMDGLPYRDDAWISGAGIAINLVIGGGVLAINALVNGRWLLGSALAALSVLLWAFRRVFVAYLVPALAFPLAGWFVWMIVAMYSEGRGQFNANVSGLLPSSPLEALALAGGVSLILGLINMMPFAPLDGGRVALAAARRLFGARAEGIAGTVMAVGGIALLGSELLFLGWLAITS